MIFRRPLLNCLSPLVICLASGPSSRAEANSPTGQPTDHPSPLTAAVPEPNDSHPAENIKDAAPPGESKPKIASDEPAPFSPAESKEKTGESDKTRPPEATQTFDQARREIIGLQNLGVSLTERGDWDAGEIAFRQILTSPRANAGDLASALLGLARVYRRQGSLTKAAAIYERYLKDYSGAVYVPDALLELGRTQRALGAHDLALAHFYSVINSTIKLSSENSEHYQILAKTAQFEIAETHFQEGNYAEANKYFSRLRLLDLAPADRARAHFKSADALYLQNDFESAVKTLNSYLEQWPKDENVPEARYLLSLSLRSLGRKQEALDATLKLLRTERAGADPKRWAYWQRRTGNQLANDFFQSGDTLNALMIYQGLAALATEPEWRLPVAYQIGLCYERMRIYDRAAAAYQGITDSVNPATGKAKGPETSKAPNAELIELAHMAAWRIEQIDWHEKTEHQLAAIFTTGDERAPKNPPSSQTIEPNIDSNVSGQPTPPLPSNDHPGNAAKTPASL